MSRHYQIIFNLLALAVIVFLSVSLFYMVIRAKLRDVDTPRDVVHRLPDVKGYRKPPLDYYSAIIKGSIFFSGEEVPSEIEGQRIEDLEPTSLKVALLGTVVGDEQSAVAVIEDINKKIQGLYRPGDSIQSAVVRKILRGKVVLRVGDRDEILTIEETAASRAEKQQVESKATGKSSTIVVGRSDLQESMNDLHELLSQARIRPQFKDGKAQGLAVTNITPGSFFEKLGLRNGDIVQGIDGRNINSPDDVLEVYSKLRSGSHIALEIMRNGVQRTLDYKFR
jgi:general secretion pathway protein C